MNKYIVGLSLFATSCQNAQESENSNLHQTENSSQNVCYAIRGNGPRIFSHFGAMAKAVEEIGIPKGAAGGSSASITSFFLESISINSALSQDDTERRKQLSLILKSMEGFLKVATTSKQVAALFYFNNVISNLRSEVNRDLGSPRETLENIRIVLSREVVGFVNPEIFTFITQSPASIEWKIQQIRSAVNEFGKFSAKDPKIFLRPGLINFDYFSEVIGRIGSFLASYAPMKDSQWQQYFELCDETKGKLWPDFSKECQDMFVNMANEFFQSEPGINRADEPISGQPGFHTLVTTSMTQQQHAVATINTLKNSYFDNSFKDGDFPELNFDDYVFGYWGKPSHLDALTARAAKNETLHWSKTFAIGQRPWKEALSLSRAVRCS